jgi:hypothetical protein
MVVLVVLVGGGGRVGARGWVVANQVVVVGGVWPKKFREGRNSALLRTASIKQKETDWEPVRLVGHKGSWVNLDLGCGLAACLRCTTKR